MRMHVLQHVPFEGLGAIEPWAAANGFHITRTRFWIDEGLPRPEEVDWLVIMGGPMNIHEHAEYPWLPREKEFIRKAITAGRTVLGVCLGAQLVADVLGGKVRKNERKEIGWFPVALTASGRQTPPFDALPESFTAFHWHGDTFAIPPGAIHSAQTEACTNQAFVYEHRVVGLQFHIEYTRDSIEAMLDHCGDEVHAAPYIQSPDTIRAGYRELPATMRCLNDLLDALLHMNS